MKMPSFSLLLAILFFLADPTNACSMAPCSVQEPAKVLESADVLFRGRLEKILTKSGREVTPRELVTTECCVGELVFEVSAAWRGVDSPEFRIRATFQNGINCARSFSLGKEYVVWSFSDVPQIGVPSGTVGVPSGTADSVQLLEEDLPLIRNCQAVGEGGWPKAVNTDVEGFAKALGPPSWEPEND